MTTVWRICRRPFADLSGDGARLYGGRWNTPGRPLIYAAETAALAVLEVRVHLDLDWDMLPDDYVLVAIDTAAIVAETIHEPPDDPRVIGDAWIEFAAIRTSACPFVDRARILQCPNQPCSPGCSIDPTRPRPAISVRPATVDAALSSSERAAPIEIGRQMPQPQPPLQRTQISMPVHFSRVPSDLLLASLLACFWSPSLVPPTPRPPTRRDEIIGAGVLARARQPADTRVPGASCFWVYAYPAFLRYAAHSAAGCWARILPQAPEIAS